MINKKQSVWTHFHDMHSGGGCKIRENKQNIEHIYIEADEKTAERYFYEIFGRDPNHITCGCCGEDYAITEGSSLAKLSAYERNCRSIKPIKMDASLGYEDPAYKTAAYTEHYWLEYGEEPPEGYTAKPSFGKYVAIEDFCKIPNVKILHLKDVCKILNRDNKK